MHFITLLDYLLLPVYILIVYGIAISVRNRFYPEGHPWRQYFTWGLLVKIGGAIFIGLVYQYYYGGGDTSNYFFHAEVINSSLSESVTKWFNLVFHIPKWYDGDYYFYTSQMYWYNSPPEYIVGCITAFLGLFTFTTYLPISVLYAAISFTGLWALFRTFATQYPAYSRYIAIAVLFIPSVAMWGSGLFKDTICLGSVGWMTYGAFRILVQRDFSLKNLAFTIVSFYLVAVIKIYILIAFLPALALWVLFNYLHKIGSKGLRFFVRLAILPIAVLGFYYASNKLSDTLGKYSLKNVAETSYATRDWINTASSASADNASTYDLGDFDPSIQGMLKKFPAAVNVTLFRPYIWEARKAISLLSALEALAFLLLTIKVLIAIGPIKIWGAIRSDPNIQFCLIFTLIFAFAVGISSFNFGALSRYRIPCLPFYAMALMLIYYKYNPPEKNIFSFRK